jgi:predicted nucleotidyltransferase
MAKSAALLRNAGARFAYLHGSRTSGQYRLDSDIDIAAYFGGHPPNAFDILMPPGVEEADGRDDNPAIHDPGTACPHP